MRGSYLSCKNVVRNAAPSGRNLGALFLCVLHVWREIEPKKRGMCISHRDATSGHRRSGRRRDAGLSTCTRRVFHGASSGGGHAPAPSPGLTLAFRGHVFGWGSRARVPKFAWSWCSGKAVCKEVTVVRLFSDRVTCRDVTGKIRWEISGFAFARCSACHLCMFGCLERHDFSWFVSRSLFCSVNFHQS